MNGFLASLHCDSALGLLPRLSAFLGGSAHPSRLNLHLFMYLIPDYKARLILLVGNGIFCPPGDYKEFCVFFMSFPEEEANQWMKCSDGRPCFTTVFFWESPFSFELYLRFFSCFWFSVSSFSRMSIECEPNFAPNLKTSLHIYKGSTETRRGAGERSTAVPGMGHLEDFHPSYPLLTQHLRGKCFKSSQHQHYRVRNVGFAIFAKLF